MAQVLYVLEIADCRSISAAAARLYLSQSALSQQVQRLEAELGYTLFPAHRAALRSHPSGEKFCREARTVADTWRSFCGKGTPRRREPQAPCASGLARGYTRTTCFRTSCASLMSTRYRVNFVTESGRDMLAGLRDGSIDFALDRLQVGDETGRTCSCAIWCMSGSALIMAQSDPLASREASPSATCTGKR